MNRKPSVLDKFKLYHERGEHDIGYVSPTAGQPKPWYDDLPSKIKHKVFGFFGDIWDAIREIINKIM